MESRPLLLLQKWAFSWPDAALYMGLELSGRWLKIHHVSLSVGKKRSSLA